jgi:predicted nuclease of predicted toxin-antitoxin system
MRQIKKGKLSLPDIRLIADENISWRLKKFLPDWLILPSNEILKNQRLNDFKIWQFAQSKAYHILTFDEDFNELQNLLGFPPKIIWMRTGNLTTQGIADKLLSLERSIIDFLNNDELGVFEIR